MSDGEALAPDAVAALEAESAAEATRVLAGIPSWIWDGERLPIPVESIVDNAYGLLVREISGGLHRAPGAPALGEGQFLSGLLLADRGEIWVDADEAREWPPRKRFTIGHELGHWVMHATSSERIFCRKPSVAPEDHVLPAALQLPAAEIAANAFAAELLLPEHRVIERHAALEGSFAVLMTEFGVSGRALERRLRALGLSVEPKAG